MGVIASSVSSLATFLLVPFATSFLTWEVSGWHIVGLAVLAGVLIQLSQVFYFQALEYSEAGIVAAYWNMTPILLPIASYLLFGQSLGFCHYLGMLGLVACSGCFCLLDQSLEGGWRSLFYMSVACCIQVGVILLEEYIFKHAPFFLAFLLVTGGIVISGFCPLLLSPVRKSFKNTLSSGKTAVAVIIGIEIINLSAIFCSQQAINQGISSLVAAVETTVPAYTFLLSILLLLLMPQYADPRVKCRLQLKLLLVSLMTIGVGILSNELT
jgi:drug/metabolite transporter (DMT)-like permease